MGWNGGVGVRGWPGQPWPAARGGPTRRREERREGRVVVEWCGRAGMEGKKKTELPKQALLRTKLKNESCLTPPCVANGSATGQSREAECGRCSSVTGQVKAAMQ